MLTILYILLWLALGCLVIYGIIWILGLLGLVIPAPIVKVIWAILLLILLIYLVSYYGPDFGSIMPRRR